MGIIATLILTAKVNEVTITEQMDRDFCSIAHLREFLDSYPVTTTSNGVTLTVNVDCLEFVFEDDLNLALLEEESEEESFNEEDAYGVFDFDTYDDTRMR